MNQNQNSNDLAELAELVRPRTPLDPDPLLVVFLAVAEGGIFTIGPGNGGQYAATLELDGRYALVQERSMHETIFELARRWRLQ